MMDRLFDTHKIRKSRELTGLWQLTAGPLATIAVTVPSVWESIPALHSYRGLGIYEKQIFCGGNIRLWFGGVSFWAKVYVDDRLLSCHYGAYSGFEALALDLTPGPHTLRVEVDNRFGGDSALHVPNDYYSYGGINRPVILEELPEVSISQLHAAPFYKDGLWRLRVQVTLRSIAGPDGEYALKIAVAGQEVLLPLSLDKRGASESEVWLDCPGITPWSPANPALYTVEATLLRNGVALDDLIDRIGFREIRTEGKAILLNGSPLKLKGFNRHEDHGNFGSAVPLEAMIQDLHLMLDLGTNCVRTCHYPNDPRFLDLCDELGMLVWEESHARGLSEQQMRHPKFMEQSILSTREMVQQHYNHPAIFIWGCLNECADDCNYGADCFRQLFRLMKELDDTRPVTAALLERPGSRVYGDGDVVSVNIYPKWYHSQSVQDRLEEKCQEIAAGGGGHLPLIVSEIGAGAIYGYHDPFGEDKWSEERQCTILQEQVGTVLAHPDCVGLFLWQFADVRVDENWAIHRPKTMNNKGVVDQFRRPKMAYRIVKELFR